MPQRSHHRVVVSPVREYSPVMGGRHGIHLAFGLIAALSILVGMTG